MGSQEYVFRFNVSVKYALTMEELKQQTTWQNVNKLKWENQRSDSCKKKKKNHPTTIAYKKNTKRVSIIWPEYIYMVKLLYLWPLLKYHSPCIRRSSRRFFGCFFLIDLFIYTCCLKFRSIMLNCVLHFLKRVISSSRWEIIMWLFVTVKISNSNKVTVWSSPGS